MSEVEWSERRMQRQAGARRSDQIEICGLEVFGYHGAYGSEQLEGQRFRLDIVLDVDMRIPARSDDLRDALDYSRVVDDVSELVRSTRYHLLEALASRIADHLLDYPRVAATAVRITKPDVALNESVTEVAVTVRRTRPPAAKP